MDDYLELLEELRHNFEFNLPFGMVSLLKKYNPDSIKKVYSLRENGLLVGYAIVVVKQSENKEYWLEFLDINTGHQRRGYGTKILDMVVKDFPVLYVHSIYDSHDFYIKFGFLVIDSYNPSNGESLLFYKNKAVVDT